MDVKLKIKNLVENLLEDPTFNYELSQERIDKLCKEVGFNYQEIEEKCKPGSTMSIILTDRVLVAGEMFDNVICENPLFVINKELKGLSLLICALIYTLHSELVELNSRA